MPIKSIDDIPLLDDCGAASVAWAVDGLMLECGIFMLTGGPGSGKSTLETAMAGTISTGREFAGIATVQQPALLIDRENPIAVVRERFHRLGVADSEMFKVWGGWNEVQPPDPDCPILLKWVSDFAPPSIPRHNLRLAHQFSKWGQ